MPPPSPGKLPLLNKLRGPAASIYGSLPKLQLPGAQVLQKHFNAHAANLLHSAGIYSRDIIPVTPRDGRLREMLPSTFITWATDYFIPIKVTKERDGSATEKMHDMTEQHAKNCLSDYKFVASLPEIHRIHPSPVPIINDAGALILCTPGYDPSSGTFVFDGVFQPVPPDPARPLLSHLLSSDGYFDDSMTLSEAFWFLQDLHRAFPFADWTGDTITPPEGDPRHAYDPVSGDHRSYQCSRSLAVHIGAMLAVFACGCVPREAPRMGFSYNANMQRSGKTLLVKLAIAAIHGSFKGQPWRENDESLIKLIDSEILAGSPYICFDNVRGLIESQALESLLTSPTWTGRHLGRSEMFTAENNSVIFITGNNISVGSDIGHRTLWCELFCEDADPQARTIDAPIIDDVWLANTANCATTIKTGRRRQLKLPSWAGGFSG